MGGEEERRREKKRRRRGAEVNADKLRLGLFYISPA